MSKQYIEGNVTYAARGRKWTFEVGTTYSYSTPRMPGGAETAHKVARIINGSIKRSNNGTMDNLGRSNMNTILHKAAKTHSRVVSPIGTFV
jgi:hypothetical protein